MANRNYNRYQALEKEVKSLFAEIAIGASGAPTLSRGIGVASIVRNSAGLYTLTLQDKYSRLMKLDITQQAAAAEDLKFQQVSSDVSSAKTIQFRCIAVAAETDPSNGSKLFVEIKLKNSSI